MLTPTAARADFDLVLKGELQEKRDLGDVWSEDDELSATLRRNSESPQCVSQVWEINEADVRRVQESASVLTACIAFGVAAGDAAWSQSDVWWGERTGLPEEYTIQPSRVAVGFSASAPSWVT